MRWCFSQVFTQEKLSRPINEKLLVKDHDENLIKVIFVKTSRNMGDEENEYKVNRHAVREYLAVLRPKAIQSCQSFHVMILTVTLNPFESNLAPV